MFSYSLPHHEDGTYRKLRKLNLLAACLHALQGAILLGMSMKFTLPVTTAFLQFDAEQERLVPVLATAFSLPIALLVALFFLLSALAHLIVSLPGTNDWYVKNLKQHINPARWVEYSLSSSLMIVLIAMLAGMYDGVSLLLIFFLNMMMILFGWMMELHNQSTDKTNWTSYVFGVLAGMIPWIAIAFYLFGAGGDTGQTPAFVYWIFFSLFIFFNCFALNMVLQYKKIGPWRNYLYGERTYIVLSLVAKTLLAWQVWGGTLRPV